MTRTIQHQYYFEHSPETVWEYLTNPELLSLWLMKNNFRPVAGQEFQFRTNPIPALNFDGIFYCRVLEIVPFQSLSYSWSSGPGNAEITLESVVVWKLQPKGEGTEVFLEHSGFGKEENLDFYNGLNHGWVEKLQKIADLLKSAQHDRSNA